ncbi:hypothetical protein [Pseudescherichia sp.]|nr:hypothetical protein [Pseudescherichia sp.]
MMTKVTGTKLKSFGEQFNDKNYKKSIELGVELHRLWGRTISV